MSEMAQTIKDNLPLIEQYSGTVFTHEFVQDLCSAFHPLKDALARLDNKDKSTHDVPTKEDTVAVLKQIHTNVDLEQTIQDAFNAAGPALMISAHVMAIGALMNIPQDFAEKCERNAANQNFKEEPSARNMRSFILDSIVKKRRPVKRTLSVWDEASEDEEDGARGGRRRPRSRRRWDEDEDDDIRSLPRSDDTPVSRKRSNASVKKSGSATKRQSKDAFSSELSDDEENLSPQPKKRRVTPKEKKTSSASKKVATPQTKEKQKPNKKTPKKATPQRPKPMEISDESSSSSDSSSSEDDTTSKKTNQPTDAKQNKRPAKENNNEKDLSTENAEKKEDVWKSLEKAIAPKKKAKSKK